ncbi:MAG TPA: hypothetical protein VNB94_13230 [Mycobacteriales bacterium]|nr:hypothetical protein [Mycobacteriales bacterium]
MSSLHEHPNCDEVVEVLARMTTLTDDQLAELAAGWCDDDVTSAGRATALGPDSPLVLEVLAAFDSLEYLYADDLQGEAAYLTISAPVTALALKAVRDAIAAAYARPVLTRSEYVALLAPWRATFPDSSYCAPDFGPQHAAVVAALGLMSSMACRSHDPHAQQRWSSVLEQGEQVDLERHGDAVDHAWDAALLTQRRRLWGLASRSGQEAFFRRCAQCDRAGHEADGVVLALCLGAVVGIMMGDVLDDDSQALLRSPLGALLAAQTTASDHY